MHVKFIKVRGANFLICCQANSCLVYNYNATRLLYKFDLRSPQEEDISYTIWFSCSSLAYSTDTGEEFIAVATSDGKIFRLSVQGGGASFTKEQSFTMGITDAILSMASDPKSKTLAVASGSGYVYFMAPKDEGEWNAVNDLGKS